MGGFNQTPPGPQGPLSSLAGNSGQPAGQQQNDLSGAVEQIRQLEMNVAALAQQFPDAANEARQAVAAIRAMLVRITSGTQPGQPPAPPSV